jgi:3-hydroxyacyl-[acyl-carrier-protein] dehydratase
MELDKKKILEFQQNRKPYLFVDHINDLEPGKYANGYFDLKKDTWFLKVHWPGDENMPGMLQIEAMVQLAALAILTLPGNKGKLMYLLSADKVKLIKKVTPNHRLYLNSKIIFYKRGIANCVAEAKINNEIVSKAEFRIILKDILKDNIYNINKKL